MTQRNNRHSHPALRWALGLLGFGVFSTAYLDPGSGSFLIQVLVASVLGVGLLVRAFWGQITGLFGRKPESPDEPTDPDQPQ